MENIKETPLCKLAYEYGTDKCPRLKHVYTPFYYEMFKDRRKSVKKVLEMGIGFTKTMPHVAVIYDKGLKRNYQRGASLKMWRDFFPNAQIHGADIAPASMFEDDRIETHLCDETKVSDIERLIEKTGSDIDLFVDDGLHKPWAQVFLAKTILPLLNDDVTYIIEDVSHNRTITKQLSEYKCESPNLPNRKYRHGKLMVITKK